MQPLDRALFKPLREAYRRFNQRISQVLSIDIDVTVFHIPFLLAVKEAHDK